MAEILTERPAAVQAGVNAYIEEHREELRRINLLSPEEQEQEFSVRIAREIDNIAKMAPQNPEKELATQIVIALETDRILALNSQRQQEIIAAKYGLDPKALIDHYPELQTQSAQLQQRLTAADKSTALMGWTAFLGTMAATLIPLGNSKKSVGDRFSGDNKFIKWISIPLISLAMGFAGSFIGSRLFGRKVKEESKALVTDSRINLERELADAIGNKVHEAIALAAAPVTPVAFAPDFKAGTDRKAPPQPRESFAAEAAKEKAAAQAAGTFIG